MCPTSREELKELTKCIVKIEFFEKTVQELRQELKNHKEEGIERKRDISNRRLAIYLASASFLGGVVVKILEFLRDLVT